MQILKISEQKLSNSITEKSIADKVEVLRAVVMLVLREIDSLEKSILVDNVNVKENDYCLPEKLQRLEIDTIRCALIKTNGRQKAAAKLLGIKHTTLNSKIKRYNIDWRLPDIDEDLIA